MKEQFDKTLRNHIKDTFGSYNDQFASDGWEKLVRKKRRKRRGLIFWYALPSGIAAALAIIWIYNWNTLMIQPVVKNQIVAKTDLKNKPQQNLTNTHQKSDPNKEQQDQVYKEGIALSENIEINKSTTTKVNQTPKIDLNLNVSDKEHNMKLNNVNTLLLSILNDRNESDNVNKNSSTNDTLSNTMLISNETIVSNNTPLENSIARETAIEIPTQKPTPSAKKSIKKVLSNSPQNLANNSVKQSKFNIAVDANTFYSFSEAGVNDQMNLGLGLAASYKIGKNLSLNSGLQLNRQTSSFEGLDRLAFSNRLAVNSAFAVIPNEQITNAKLIGLDIPLNLQYNFKMGKALSFITTGFSSYSVINEEYVNDISVTNYYFTGVNTSNMTTVQENPAGSFTYFKFARTLNVSFGVQYPLKGKNSLSVEPFLKYPLSGFGYQDLLIGSGGLSLKFNFNK